MVHFNLGSGKKIFILPGFSEKSLCWTVGRINRFIDIINEKGFGEIFIFDFGDVKRLTKIP